MLILDFCNIKEWSPAIVLDLYKKNRIIHSRRGAHDGFEKYCLSNRGPKSLVFLLVKASEIEPWLSEDDEIVSLAKWLGVHCALFPSNDGYPEIWRHLQQSRDEFYAPFLDKCSKGDLDLDFINDILEDFQEIGFSMAFSGQPDKWDKKSGITWHFRGEYLKTLEDHINWGILSNFLAQKAGVFKKVRKCAWCERYFISNRRDQKYCSDKCSSTKRSHDFRKTGNHAAYMQEHTVSGVYIKVADRR